MNATGNTELTISTDLSALPSIIEFNYDELKAWLDDRLEKYRGAVITEAEYGQAKKDRAALNKVSAALKKAATDTKARLLAPFEPFKGKVDELVGMVTSVSGAMDEQVKAIEAARKAKRKEELTTYLCARVAEAYQGEGEARFIESPYWKTFFDDVYPRLLNASITDTFAHDEINRTVDETRNAVEQVRTIYADKPEEIRLKAEIELARAFNLTQTLNSINAYIREQEELAAARKRDEERKAAAEAAKAAEKPTQPTATVAQPTATPTKPAQATATPAKIYRARYEVVGTADAIKAFVAAAAQYNITITRITA